MKKLLGLFVLVTILLTIGFASAGARCDGADLCTWSNPLPLGSSPSVCSGLSYNTEWPINTDTTANNLTILFFLKSALLLPSCWIKGDSFR